LTYNQHRKRQTFFALKPEKTEPTTKPWGIGKPTKITERIKGLTGVDAAFWNATPLSLAVYYDPKKTSIDDLKRGINVEVGHLIAQGAIAKVNLYSV